MVEYAVVALAPLRCVAYSGEDVLEALHAGVNVVDGLPQEAEGFERISWECASGRDDGGGEARLAFADTPSRGPNGYINVHSVDLRVSEKVVDDERERVGRTEVGRLGARSRAPDAAE